MIGNLLDEGLSARLRCPDCRSRLSIGTHAIVCENMHSFSWRAGRPCFLTAEDLPPRAQAAGDAAFERAGSIHNWAVRHWNGFHLDSLVPHANGALSTALCVGGGDSDEKALLARKGYVVNSLDVDPIEGVDILADAHVIPFADQSFDLATSFEVLEHLQEPWRAVDEIARVLKPGGAFVGSVAFMKPFHNSYFHMTHKGVLSLLKRSGMVPDRVYGVQNPLVHVVGALVPLGPRKISSGLYNRLYRSIAWARSRAWSVSRRRDAHAKSHLYEQSVPLTFAEFDRLRFSSTVVFSAKKR